MLRGFQTSSWYRWVSIVVKSGIMSARNANMPMARAQFNQMCTNMIWLNLTISYSSLISVKFPHSPYYIMHSVLEQRKQWQKQYISIGKTDLFYNSMGLCGNFTLISNTSTLTRTHLVYWAHGWNDLSRRRQQELAPKLCNVLKVFPLRSYIALQRILLH